MNSSPPVKYTCWSDTFNTRPVAEGLQLAVGRSKYLRYCPPEENTHVEIRYEAGVVSLHRRQVRIASQRIDEAQGTLPETFGDIVMHAERLSRAHRVLELRCEGGEESLEHAVDFQVGFVEEKKPGRLFQKSDNRVNEGDRLYIRLNNKGDSPVYVSVFNVNIAGHIFLLTPRHPLGMKIPPGESKAIGYTAFNVLKGLEMVWPEGLSRDSPIEEWFLFVLSGAPVDLRYLCDSMDRDLISTLNRNVLLPEEESLDNRYDIAYIPFSFHPAAAEPGNGLAIEKVTPFPPDEGDIQPMDTMQEQQHIPAAELPEPESMTEHDDAPPTVIGKGIFGAIKRAHIPLLIRVVNQHDEEITVVVSKYRPNRMLSGASVNASATGGGIEFNTTTFVGPATKKTLLPWDGSDTGPTATFPLSTRKEGFGVITIFKGPQKTLYIENDRVPLGATAYFVNKPDLKIIEYATKQVSWGSRKLN
ncbi:uncharacterized protein GIQ15_03650 [Arthroderma uncinatum]|uniref:uncharacterized protein n=1 Tax=Arthroderma uncinatum TaxID=74035 RepID=UPI00144A6C35|nr:uncharacterized protein GIQ15_03650 [Arthroderma uncinatum]KAF3484326.1 hypothetical protein GIQ15_03650 [Arthroderma uncinatum]